MGVRRVITGSPPPELPESCKPKKLEPKSFADVVARMERDERAAYPNGRPPPKSMQTDQLATPDGKPTVADVFADRARMKKVEKLIAKVPNPADRKAAEEIMRILVDAVPSRRRQLAKEAGCSFPSDRTWKLLIEAVRKRDEDLTVPF